MQLNEIKNKKKELQIKIAEQLMLFEKETQLTVEGIDCHKFYLQGDDNHIVVKVEVNL